MLNIENQVSSLITIPAESLLFFFLLIVDGNNDQGVFFYIRPYYLYFSTR